MPEIKKILLPIDFSETTNELVDYALFISETYGAKIEVLHVVHQLVNITGFYIPHVSFDLIEDDMENTAIKNMGDFCEKNIKGKVDFEIHTKRGVPYDEIIKSAKELAVDLIVMGTHGATGLDHFMFGSNAEKVVRMSPVPVLTVRAKKAD